jgi:hypothetical protein
MKTIRKSEIMQMLGNFKSVKNTPSRNGYGQAPNQFEIRFENGRVFQSYNSLIAVKMNDGRIYLTNDHEYSNTTSGHVGRWLGGMSAKERRQALCNETITLITED